MHDAATPPAAPVPDPLMLRVLIVAPSRRDADIAVRVLADAGLAAAPCAPPALDDEIARGAAAVLLTDDVIESMDMSSLVEAIQRQPDWSDLPLVVLARGGAPSEALGRLLAIGSVTLLERSVHIRTLVSAVQTAVRARGRQYQIRDLLERERAARQDADRANHAKDRFLAVLSHELRTPLTPIVFAVATLRDAKGSGRMRRALDMISRNVALETKLIDDLLDLNRVVQGKLQLQYDDVDMHEKLRDTATMVDSDARAKSLTIRMTCGAEYSRVRADPARVHQVLWNLAKNAIKFTPAGGTIVFETWNEGDHFLLSCRDSGIGIAPDALARIFEPFVQGGDEITRVYGGLGLGLAVSRSLADAHGGYLTAHSAGTGLGSTFTLCLPNVITAAADAPVASGPDAIAAGDGRRLRILLVEDHQDTARVLFEALTSHGHTVRMVHAVVDALRAAAADQYEVLVSDIGLPDGSGLDLIRQIKPRLSHGAIALSGFGMDEDIARSRSAGFDLHLTKPVDVSRLHVAISELATVTH